jgi:hypothetical protein
MKGKLKNEGAAFKERTHTRPSNRVPPARSQVGYQTKTGQGTRQNTDGMITLMIIHTRK